MQLATRKWRVLLSVLMAGIVLRAFIPAGYMPAAPGKGLLFELCHEGLPVSFMAALDDGHGHHAHNDSHSEHAAAGDCSIGHLLSMAFIDGSQIVEPAIQPSLGILVTAPLQQLLRGFSGVYSARAPPLP